MNFIIIDILLLVIFIATASIFLYYKRKNLKKEGILLLYKTSWGINLINNIGGKYKKILKFLSYVSVVLGYILMIGILFLIGNSVYLYLTTQIASIVKAPPIAPLFPYFPKVFGLESFFPPFYFIYFIAAILIVATVHEFSHGIFARRFGIKIKSTGFAFLKYFPALFGAFVEQDEKQMNKAKKFEQMSILSAGVFANVIIAVLFYFILFGFFSMTFSPIGVQFNTYSYSIVNIDELTAINGIAVSSYEEVLTNANENSLNNITAKKNYVVMKSDLEKQKENQESVLIYDDAPAVNHNLSNIILEIEGTKINSLEKLRGELQRYTSGEKVLIKTSDGKTISEKEIILGENPEDKNLPWLGIGFYENNRGRISQIVTKIFPPYQEPNVYYEPKNSTALFIKDFLWWVMIINLLVALFNMLPLGILDGGRFFYLTVAGITGSEKIAKKFFGIINYMILLLFLILMVKWIFSF